jgi:hypothetical protein
MASRQLRDLLLFGLESFTLSWSLAVRLQLRIRAGALEINCSCVLNAHILHWAPFLETLDSNLVVLGVLK